MSKFTVHVPETTAEGQWRTPEDKRYMTRAVVCRDACVPTTMEGTNMTIAWDKVTINANQIDYEVLFTLLSVGLHHYRDIAPTQEEFFCVQVVGEDLVNTLKKAKYLEVFTPRLAEQPLGYEIHVNVEGEFKPLRPSGSDTPYLFPEYRDAKKMAMITHPMDHDDINEVRIVPLLEEGV